MLPQLLLAACMVAAVRAQSSDTRSSRTTSSTSDSTSATALRTYHSVSVSLPGSIVTDASVAVPSGSYDIITGTQFTAMTVLDTTTASVTGSMARNSSSSSSSNPYLIVGGATTTTRNGTATATTSTATPTNTQPCNGYPEFCSRKYSNITQVTAHNAALVKKNNAFSNQQVPIVGQLNDGIRMIQGEVHYVNNTLYNCHSDCNFLNTGPYQDTLDTVKRWLDEHPYDVVTLLIVNSNYADVTVFEPVFEASGIIDSIYLPSERPMRLDDWPTLAEMILSGKRVVVFMDYMANATAVPYILDEFSNMFETPFSPTNINFPCTEQRPPGLAESDAREHYLYLANHNLNVEISLSGSSILIPDFADLAVVNADNSSTGSLLNMAEECKSTWGRPPNFLLVDFYDIGAGSVFEVAATMNNVTYDKNCCGLDVAISEAGSLKASLRTAVTALGLMLGALALAL